MQGLSSKHCHFQKKVLAYFSRDSLKLTPSFIPLPSLTFLSSDSSECYSSVSTCFSCFEMFEPVYIIILNLTSKWTEGINSCLISFFFHQLITKTIQLIPSTEAIDPVDTALTNL